MTIKLVDEHSINHVEGHEWPRWNFPLINNMRNFEGPNIELDNGDTWCIPCVQCRHRGKSVSIHVIEGEKNIRRGWIVLAFFGFLF